MEKDQPSDEMLLRRIQAGDEEAFVAIYRRHQGRIFRYALRMSSSTSAAEDITQEVFIALIESPARFVPAAGPLAAYLFGIARNQVLRRLRRERRFVPGPDPGGEGAALPAAWIVREDPAQALDQSQKVAQVRRAVAALPVHYREAIVMCDLEGLSYAETAAMIGCSEGTVRSRLHRARSLLVERLSRRNEKESGMAKANPVRCPV